MIFEFCDHDLCGLMEEQKASSRSVKFSRAQIKYYIHSVLSGLQECHQAGILHRDLKGARARAAHVQHGRAS
jgi:cyclin-dependent kinase 12/13